MTDWIPAGIRNYLRERGVDPETVTDIDESRDLIDVDPEDGWAQYAFIGPYILRVGVVVDGRPAHHEFRIPPDEWKRLQGETKPTIEAMLSAILAYYGSQKRAAQAIGCADRTLRYWLRGQQYPRPISEHAIRRTYGELPGEGGVTWKH